MSRRATSLSRWWSESVRIAMCAAPPFAAASAKASPAGIWSPCACSSSSGWYGLPPKIRLHPASHSFAGAGIHRSVSTASKSFSPLWKILKASSTVLTTVTSWSASVWCAESWFHCASSITRTFIAFLLVKNRWFGSASSLNAILTLPILAE